MTLYCKIYVMEDRLREGGDINYVKKYDNDCKLSDFYYGEQWYERLLFKHITYNDFKNLNENRKIIIKESKPGDFPIFKIEITPITEEEYANDGLEKQKPTKPDDFHAEDIEYLELIIKQKRYGYICDTLNNYCHEGFSIKTVNRADKCIELGICSLSVNIQSDRVFDIYKEDLKIFALDEKPTTLWPDALKDGLLKLAKEVVKLSKQGQEGC